MSVVDLGAHLKAMANNAIDNDTVLARGMAHAAFDRIWKQRVMSRREAYQWLQQAMQMTETEAHMERMNSQQCKEVIAQVKKDFPWLR